MVPLLGAFQLLTTKINGNCVAGRYLPALFLVIGNSDQRESL